MKPKFKNNTLESTLKSKETEEWIDLYFYRYIGYYIALYFSKKKITPNQVTITSIFIGILAGILLFFQKKSINLLGFFLLILANTLDSADGQLARMTNQTSIIGRILDGLCGFFWFTSIYISIIFRSEENFIFFLSFFSGFCHLTQTSMSDYYRNLHLFFIQGKNKSELDNSKRIIKEYNSINWKKQPLIKVAKFFYLHYTIRQEKQTPQLQKFLYIIDTKYSNTVPSWLRKIFKKKSLPLIKYTNLLSFNLRFIILFICILTNFSILYFIFEITIMNLLLFYMINRYERIGSNLSQII